MCWPGTACQSDSPLVTQQAASHVARFALLVRHSHSWGVGSGAPFRRVCAWSMAHRKPSSFLPLSSILRPPCSVPNAQKCFFPALRPSYPMRPCWSPGQFLHLPSPALSVKRWCFSALPIPCSEMLLRPCPPYTLLQKRFPPIIRSTCDLPSFYPVGEFHRVPRLPHPASSAEKRRRRLVVGSEWWLEGRGGGEESGGMR